MLGEASEVLSGVEYTTGTAVLEERTAAPELLKVGVAHVHRLEVGSDPNGHRRTVRNGLAPTLNANMLS